MGFFRKKGSKNDHVHEYEILKTFETEKYESSLFGADKTLEYVIVQRCKTCGDIKIDRIEL